MLIKYAHQVVALEYLSKNYVGSLDEKSKMKNLVISSL